MGHSVMFLMKQLSAALAWLGRRGTRAIAAIVFVAIALPPLDALLKPFVTEAIFALLAIAFLRVDLGVLRGYLDRPRWCCWQRSGAPWSCQACLARAAFLWGSTRARRDYF